MRRALAIAGILILSLTPLAAQSNRPSIQIAHEIFTNQSLIQLEGAVTPAQAIKEITWHSLTGAGGRAAVDENQHWTAGPIGLRPGANRVKITAVDKSNQSATAFVTIYSNPPDSPPAAPIDIRTGVYRGRKVTYHVVDGRAIYEGDILLGTAAHQSRSGPRPAGIAMAYSSGLWPASGGVAHVPYVLSAGTQSSAAAVTAINNAISSFNTSLSSIIQYVPRTSETNYVNFNLTPGDHSQVCFSFVGMIGGAQDIGGSIDCTTGEFLHEMGHAIGSWHEQQRADRNTFINVISANVDKPFLDNFDQLLDNEVDVGLYDYASIMHYFAEAFSKDGLSPTIESLPAGIPLSSDTQYTAGNVDTFKRLYGHAPTTVTIDSNPSGAQVIVDGITLTMPQTFNWALNSTHTLDLPADPQTIGGAPYLFGRWNDSAGTTRSHSITVTPGDGSLFSPATSPAATVITANFVSIHYYVQPANVTQIPAPQTIPGHNYYVDRQQVTFTATPTAGNGFYNWFNVSLFNLYQNPLAIFVESDMSSVIAGFVASPVTMITGTAPGIPATGSFPGFSITVDGSPVATPRNFAAANDGATWASGHSHTLAASTQSPVTTNISYAFANWSSNVASPSSASTSFNTTASNQTVTASFTPSFAATLAASPSCAGSVNPAPSGTSFADGTSLSLHAVANPSFAFAGWSQDLSGTANPFALTVHDEILATANFNVTGTSAPLSIGALNPATATATAAAQDIVITGTGFTNSTAAFFDGNFRSSTFNSATQLTLHLQAGDLTVPGYFQLQVQNTANACTVFEDTTYVVKTAPAAPILAVAKSHTGNFTQGQTGAQYTILATNNGTASTDGSTVTVTDTLPAGLTATALTGTGWSCTLATLTCTRATVLNPGLSYPALTLTVTVAFNATSPQVNQVAVSGGGSATANTSDSTTITANPPVLTIAKSHTGSFTQGQQNAAYTVTVSNTAGKGPTSGTVTVTETLPSGLTLVSMSGTGWTCTTPPTCTRSDALNGGASYPPITVTVNVAFNATSPQVNQVAVSGGGSAGANTSDSTTITLNQPALTLNRKTLNFGFSGSLITSTQPVILSFTGGLGTAWTASSNQSNITVTPPSGTGNALLQISAGPGPGGTVTVTAAGAVNSPQQIQINVSSVTPATPFGSFDTPINNTTGITGAIPVTGWALDNIEVANVDVWREPIGAEPVAANGLVFIGNAVFVADARPDVEAQFPNAPWNYRAGWGYLLLTNMLPGSGNGTYKLHAIAHNKSGSAVDLGTRTITADNAHAAKPFGTIDTPDQGGIASGAQFVNFGWALTPNPACIPTDGSTITVFVDGVPLGHPTYNQPRSDISTAFPGLCNSNGGVGYFFLNTTQLTNGVHTISWVAYDNQGRGDGLGSRYFDVFNAGGSPVALPDEPAAPPESVPENIEMEELGRIEFATGASRGSLVVNGERRPLPPGSTLRKGTFYWQPGPGFQGTYDLEFRRPNGSIARTQVRIRPKQFSAAHERK